MRGADYRPADSLGALVAQAADALRETDRALVTVYHGELDATGHTFGCALRRLALPARRTWTSWPSSSPRRCRPAPRCTSPPTTAWWTSRPDDRIDVDALPGLRDGRGAARRRAAGPARVRRARRGRRRARGVAARCSASGPGCCPGTRRSRRAGSARSSPALAARIGDVVAARGRARSRSSPPRPSRWSPRWWACTARSPPPTSSCRARCWPRPTGSGLVRPTAPCSRIAAPGRKPCAARPQSRPTGTGTIPAR